jgi:hypothetical protein
MHSAVFRKSSSSFRCSVTRWLCRLEAPLAMALMKHTPCISVRLRNCCPPVVRRCDPSKRSEGRVVEGCGPTTHQRRGVTELQRIVTLITAPSTPRCSGNGKPSTKCKGNCDRKRRKWPIDTRCVAAGGGCCPPYVTSPNPNGLTVPLCLPVLVCISGSSAAVGRGK